MIFESMINDPMNGKNTQRKIDHTHTDIYTTYTRENHSCENATGHFHSHLRSYIYFDYKRF